MERYAALVTLPSHALAYVPVDAVDRQAATGQLEDGMVVHALFSDDQLRAIQDSLERMDDTDVRKRFAVVLIPHDSQAVVTPVWAHSPAQAQAAAANLMLDSHGRGPRVNVGAFEMIDIQAMRDCLITSRVHYAQPAEDA